MLSGQLCKRFLLDDYSTLGPVFYAHLKRSPSNDEITAVIAPHCSNLMQKNNMRLRVCISKFLSNDEPLEDFKNY